MKTTNEKSAEVLNDLIEINNDRIKGYQKAAKGTADKDSDLRNIFNDMADESTEYASELRRYVQERGEEPAQGTTARGKIYRVWMDAKATFTGRDRKAILASCEFGEDAAQKAYESALSSSNELMPEVRELIMEQKMNLKKAHDHIKYLRDHQPA